MFARHVSMHLKANSVGEFSRTMEKEIIPELRKQRGFQDEITFIASEGTGAVAISLWDQKENAEAYSRATYPEVLKALAKVLDGALHIQTYEVANSTFHTILARGAALNNEAPGLVGAAKSAL
ncbi:MAG: hypothetical protein ABSE93_01155 [Terriglobia bacterium]